MHLVRDKGIVLILVYMVICKNEKRENGRKNQRSSEGEEV